MDNSPGRLLVVDGSVQSIDLISHWLITEGFIDVYTADGGTNALAKAEIIEPDVIVINVNLPDMSGFDLCKQIKNIMTYVLVLCISYVENEADRIRAVEAGADDFYLENGDSFQFLAKIRNLLRLKHLSNQIRRQYAELEERNKVMERHMQMGRKVQRALIPDIDMSFKDCKLLSTYHPAMGVGGDFYNILQIDKNNLGIVMGDVSGHGIASSFLTVTLNVMIKNLTNWHLRPAELLFHLNNEMCELIEEGDDDPALYASVFYAVVDTELKRIRFANSGLVFPLLVDSREGDAVKLEASGTPIGMMPGIKYDEQVVSYHNGDMVLFFTDGLQDFYYKNQPDEFSRHLIDLILELYTQKSMQEILDNICSYFYKVDASENERMAMDDVSIMLCKL